jgi:hypothetical protein
VRLSPSLITQQTSGYGQETGKFSPTKTGMLSPTVTLYDRIFRIFYDERDKLLLKKKQKGSSNITGVYYFTVTWQRALHCYQMRSLSNQEL